MSKNQSTALEIVRYHLKPEWSRDGIFLLFVLLLLPVTYMALTYPPPLLQQGQAHRIFYFHVPVAWVALYAPLISAVTGMLYIFTRNERYDVWSLANARLSMLFSIGVVITGMIWASSEWGIAWKWTDERLMTFFILGLALCGYFLVRFMTEDPRRRAVYAAYMAVVSALAALLTFYIIRWVTPDLHPTSVLGDMSPRIKQTFWISVLVYHFFFLALLRLAVRHEYIHRAFERMRALKS
ncbi:MAG: cytochrome c biogenesis protein CcsA [Leptospiraceae bacterium]|nr:cytochrome c biogenesis protein CcsA [Leptospiraceae bacterium]